ncbi:MAG: tripartite tricarboxylate transporter substrate-binding protein [Paracoccaceae bacterium]|nr:tripartite tricarboxylate transporter substrate-binding protein [Paracoccaceae bacterium]
MKILKSTKLFLKSTVVSMALVAFGSGHVVVAETPPAIQAITHAGFGGGTDVTTRMMLLRARRVLKQDMQLVNKKGGGGAASMDYMMSLPADGQHTLTWTTGHAVSMALGKTDVSLSDMRPLARGTDDPQLFVVNCNADIKDASIFINTQKTKSLSYGTTHTGGIDDVSAVAFTKKGGLKDPKIVAYKGVAPIKTNLIKGDIDVGVLNLGEALTEINEGLLCVSIVLANDRMAKIGDSPTAKELGIPVSLSTVRGFVTKAGVSDTRAEELEAGMLTAMGHNYYKNFLTEIGLDDTSVVGADEWGRQMESMLADMTAALKDLGYIN